jgi:hypothetical protein
MGSRLLRRWLHRPLRDTRCSRRASTPSRRCCDGNYRFEALRERSSPSATSSASSPGSPWHRPGRGTCAACCWPCSACRRCARPPAAARRCPGATREAGRVSRARRSARPRADRQPARGDPRRRRDRHGLRQRARRAARHQRERRRRAAADRGPRARAHGAGHAQGRLQPRARLLHRISRSQSEERAGRTTSAARR